MARANRHYVSGKIWHITHRCHEKMFLLKFTKDKKRWLHWLFEARRRYGIIILNYIVTSNHIHLVVASDRNPDVIPKAIQLVAGRTAQEYNIRKKRKGAFWEDRYHATAIQSGDHLLRCLAYVDLNMVRAGVVDHPKEWPFSGYNEIQNPKRKCILIAYEQLAALCGYDSFKSFQFMHMALVEQTLSGCRVKRDSRWSQSLAVGDEGFITEIKDRLSHRAKGRKVEATDDNFCLRETVLPYNALFDTQKINIDLKNTYLWA